MSSIMGRLTALVLILTLFAVFTGCQSSFVRSAKIYIQQDDPENAKQILLDGAKATPGDAELFYVLGKVHADLEEWKEMVEAFDKSLALTDAFKEDIESTKHESWRMIFNSTVEPFNNGEYDVALEKFKTALLIAPDNEETVKRIGLCYLQMEDFENCEIYLKKTMEMNANDVGTRFNLLGVYAMQKRWDDVISLADDILSINRSMPDDKKLEQEKITNVISRKAVAYQQKEDKDNAIRAWDEAIEGNPGVADFYYNKALLLHTMEKWDEATEAYLKVLEINPEDEEARLNVAKALFTTQKWDTLIDVLEPLLYPNGEVVDYEPTFTDNNAWLMLNAAYINTGAQSKASVTTKILKKLQESE